MIVLNIETLRSINSHKVQPYVSTDPHFSTDPHDSPDYAQLVVVKTLPAAL